MSHYAEHLLATRSQVYGPGPVETGKAAPKAREATE